MECILTKNAMAFALGSVARDEEDVLTYGWHLDRRLFGDGLVHFLVQFGLVRWVVHVHSSHTLS